MNKQADYVEKLSAQIVELDVKLDHLKYKVEGATDEESPALYRTISALQQKRDKAAVELQGLAVANDDEWEDLKSGAEEFLDEYRTLLYDAFKKP